MASTTREAHGIHRRTPIVCTDALRNSLERRVAKRGPDDCWNWTAATRSGYGAIKHQGKVLSAHCVAFVLNGGEIPEGHIVLHSCDNRLCCNPSHLEAGTPRQNVMDMFSRGRRDMSGEQCPASKITDSVARIVKSIRVVTGFGCRKVARLSGVSKGIANDILRCRSWTHIPWPSHEEATVILTEAGIRTEEPTT